MALNDKTRVVLAGAIGNVLEWYDFGLYGLLAPVLAQRFFPARDPLAALLGVFAGFAVGFAMRPIGAVLLGRVGDRQGRKQVLLVSVLLMGVATVAVGLLPTYETVGAWAPALLVATRLFQGISVGGEYVGSVTYLVETAPPQRRGLAGSTANLGATVGMLLGAGAASLALLPAGDGGVWWRVPFLAGGILAVAAFWMRRGLPPEPLEAARRSEGPAELTARWPAIEALRRFPRLMAILILFTCGYGVSNYLIMVFLPTFGQEFARVDASLALRINTAGQALALALVPFGGWISDRWMRRRTLLVLAFVAQAALGWELFARVLRQGGAGLWWAQLVLAGLLALVMGAAPAMLAEQFPPGLRVSGHALALNLGIGLAGGTAPLIAIALIRASHNPLSAAAYLDAGAAAAAIAVLFLTDRSREPLRSPTAARNVTASPATGGE